MKRRYIFFLGILVASVFGIGGCTEPNIKESTVPHVQIESQRGIEDVQKEETSDEVEEIQIETEDTIETSDEMPQSSEDAEYVQLREDAFYFISEFLISFNNFDEEALKNMMTDDYYNAIIEFKQSHPTEEELEKAIDEETAAFWDALRKKETTLSHDYSVLKLVGKIDISYYPTSILGSEYYNPHWNIIDGWDAMAVTITIRTDGIGSGTPEFGYTLKLGFTILYDINGKLMVKDVGPIDMII